MGFSYIDFDGFFRFGNIAYLYISVAFIQMLKGLSASACYKNLNSKNN